MGIGVFTGSKKSMVGPAESRVEIPIIDKRSGQVISTTPTSVQIMDLETFEMFETPTPTEEDLKSSLKSGVEIEYWRVLGRNKIIRVK